MDIGYESLLVVNDEAANPRWRCPASGLVACPLRHLPCYVSLPTMLKSVTALMLKTADLANRSRQIKVPL